MPEDVTQAIEKPGISPEAPMKETAEIPAAGGEIVQNIVDSATTTPTEGEKSAEAPTPEQAAKREGRRFERRLDKAYRRAAEAQARAELLEKRIAELQQPETLQGEPKLEHFDFDPEKYAAAKAEFAKAQAIKDYEAKQRTEAGRQEIQRLVSSWEEKVAQAEDKYEDFHEKVGDLTPNTPLIASIMEAENGPDIAHYLANHLKEAQRIAALPVRSQLREIGKLEAKLLSETSKPKTPSKAPAPITPLGGKSGASSDMPSDTDDVKTWMRKENARMKKAAA